MKSDWTARIQATVPSPGAEGSGGRAGCVVEFGGYTLAGRYSKEGV